MPNNYDTNVPEIFELICDRRVYHTDDDFFAEMKKDVSGEIFKQIYNLLNEITPLPEPAYYGRVYILSDRIE